MARLIWLNMFPPNYGISETLSPRFVMAGLQIIYKQHFRVYFGSYVQTHEEHDNIIQSLTIGSIPLRPTGNSQGGHFFLSLPTVQRIFKIHWTDLPIHKDTINQFHVLSICIHLDPGIAFLWRDGTPIDKVWYSYNDSDYDPDRKPYQYHYDDDDTTAVVNE